MKHHWWHFIYGKEEKKEVVGVLDKDGSGTHNYYILCKKCKKVLDSYGMTTFSLPPFIIKND